MTHQYLINIGLDALCQLQYRPLMKLEQFRLDKKLSYGQLASRLGAKHATIVRRWCLPKNHLQKMIPSERYMTAIINYTQSAVQPNDFYRE